MTYIDELEDVLDREDAIDTLMAYGLTYSQAYHMASDHFGSPEPQPVDVVDREYAMADPYSEYE